MWRTTNAGGTHDVVDYNLGCGRRHLSVDVSYPINRVLICGRWISHGQLFTSEPRESPCKLLIYGTKSISHKHSMSLHQARRFKMLNIVYVNEFGRTRIRVCSISADALASDAAIALVDIMLPMCIMCLCASIGVDFFHIPAPYACQGM